MINPHAHRLAEMVDDVRQRAANVDHPWDARAIDWPDLTPESVVVEVGGYCGRWSLQIAERYHPRLFVFEPQPWAHAVCQAVMGDRATVLPYGLGDRTDVLQMGEWETDGCSFVKASGTDRYGMIREIGAIFEFMDITTIDLLLMNIEGYEYTLLPHMLNIGLLPRRLMVQFHLFNDSGVKMAQLFDRLAGVGYRVLWTYGVVLTAWELGV